MSADPAAPEPSAPAPDERLVAIGDVHGCARTLDALLARLAPTPDDHLVFVGDYIDRGPDVRGVMDRLVALADAAAAGRGPRCTFLRGNHDQMMLDWVDDGTGSTLDLWLANGGRATLAAYADGEHLQVPDAHLDLLRQTRLVVETAHFVFVHAGLDPRRSVAENLARGTARTFLWERGHLDADLRRWEKTVVCGHTPVQEPVNRPHLINVDTGAVYAHVPGYGRLTAVRLPERAFVQVPYQG